MDGLKNVNDCFKKILLNWNISNSFQMAFGTVQRLEIFTLYIENVILFSIQPTILIVMSDIYASKKCFFYHVLSCIYQLLKHF